MKKAVLVLCMIFFSISLVSAVDIALTKSSYYPGETLQAEIPAAPFIEPLSIGNIGIYKGAAVHKTPAQSGLIKSGSKYFYYAVLPDASGSQGEYSLRIEDTNHYENNAPTEETIEKNFTITLTNSSYLSFSPGHVYTAGDFSVKIKAYNAEQQIAVDFPEAGFKQAFSLGYGMEKTVYISISGVAGTAKSNIKVNSYNIPAVVIGKAIPSSEDNETEAEEEEFEDMISLSPESIYAPVLAGINFDYSIKITKETSADLENIEISSSSSEIKPKKSSINLTDDEEVLEIIVNSDRDMNGKITLEYNGEEIEIPVNITIAENESRVFSGTPSQGETKTCAGKGGAICNKSLGETCTGSQEYSSDGVCCIGACEVKEASSGWIWGILILIILGIVGWYLYRKSKGGPGIGAIGGIFRKKTEAYEKRIRPESAHPSVEVRKSLSKD